MKHKILKILFLVIIGQANILLAGHPETNKLVNQAKQETGEIDSRELKKMLDEGKNIILLDVREINQRAEGEIFADDHYAITRGSLEFEVLNKIKNKDALIVTYCRGGFRSALAAQTLRKLGYKNAINLKDGLKGWAKEGYDIDTGLGITRLYK
ncbi:MAG: rhodanese-like domain-containing protein [Thiovulaceae bacterium]|nr:rhodanese-like domain-containing protein [Sulfurimonadaceae bacterium]